VIYVDTKENIQVFTEEDLAFLTSIANELAISIEHLRFRDELISKERVAAIGETITSVAHNVKNMLLLSKGGRDLMDKHIEQGSIESIKECWGVITTGLDKISSLVKDMLDFSRKRKVEYSECDLNEIIRDIAKSFEGELNEKGIQLALNLDTHIQSRQLDSEGLQRAIVNLVVNAIQAISRKDGEISIETELVSSDSISIKVGDNGCGVSQEDENFIFSPFYTTKGTSGTGLGLSITKKNIEEMGGTIEFVSEEDHGTLFIIKLPLMETITDDML
jgi:signal transduction histidine kinase